MAKPHPKISRKGAKILFLGGFAPLRDQSFYAYDAHFALVRCRRLRNTQISKAPKYLKVQNSLLKKNPQKWLCASQQISYAYAVKKLFQTTMI
ncbi:MAG: hypothetical protein HC810_04185 [Acaryochloridaceae cyanobacterium RL_2_7]|nr:hypothetical protein [Acaryochloridaceae cyanobacterium RL_2_7]